MPDKVAGLRPKFNAIDAAELTERCGDFASDWITAVRQRDELYAALEQVETWWLEQGMQLFPGAPACIFNARAALAKARGGEIA